ncbi:MAG: class I SAM-dependent methyltransferase [Ruminococcus sp.]|nr:class I SAM-dependent methyltransferase [Ruminococcus sp.]
MITLDSRLSLCASFVRQDSKLADIGTDHAYLPVWLCQNGVCKSAIAADINPEPLSRGQLTIAQAGLEDKVKTRLSDGLKSISADEADDIVIAGMGGELIAKIILDCEYSRDKSKRFILQPMTKSELLIERLCQNGFEILSQDCCVASNKCYTVLLVQYSGEKRAYSEVYPYICELKPKENETHLRFIKAHIERLLKKANGDAGFAVLAEKLKESIYGDC